MTQTLTSTALYTPPIWAPLAASALARLRASYATEDAKSLEHQAGARKMSDRGPSPLLNSRHAVHIPFDEQMEIIAAGGDPLATDGHGNDRHAIHIPTSDLVLLMRLCATLRTQSCIDAIMAPGALTVIDVGSDTAQTLVDVEAMLIRALLPVDAEIINNERAPQRMSSQQLIIHDIAPARTSGRDMVARSTLDIKRTLDEPRPVLILTVATSLLPEALAPAMPQALTLAPLGHDILMAILAASHSATGRIDPAVRDALPDDRALSTLDPTCLSLAMRAPTPGAVAEQLKRLAAKPPASGPTLDDIDGYGAAEGVARRMVRDLKAWAQGHVAWPDLQRSVLFYGPPGTGKSYLARAMAGSAEATLVRGSFAAWQSKGHLGDMLGAMRKSFDDAKAARPAILVIDEIDAVGDRADRERNNSNYRTQVINGFLEALDALATVEGVMVVGTTNYPDRIDAAILRPGRIDQRAEVPLPGPKALARMIRAGLGADIAPEQMARLTRAATGGTAADLDGALRAARSAARDEGRAANPADLLAELDVGPCEANPVRDRRVALHECGHAIVGAVLGLGKVKRLIMTRQGGQAWMSYAGGEGLLEDFGDELTYSLAGRAAERLVLGTVTGGAGGNAISDLAHATQTATTIDTRYGLGAEGQVWLDVSSATYLRDPANAARIRARLEDAEARAGQILTPRRALLGRMAEDLLAQGMLEGERLEAWLEGVHRETSEHPQDKGRKSGEPEGSCM
ncbi:AAA family ATPase [Roseovarius nanhaiticus]|uniref:AAA family ATPase n=1 Tax=Roseovarius nanhaiticus TaxID=573024 RepID=UPI0024925E71|nr:AAA family ATPase [Roseovarius nanhaiticus]